MGENTKILIVDIDGTVCDSSERLAAIGYNPALPADQWPKDWGDHMLDKPIPEVLDMINVLFHRYEIWYVTIRWAEPSSLLWAHSHLTYDELFCLGKEGNITERPEEVKRNWLRSLPHSQRCRITAAFEDSPSMIKMFREEGIKTLDVGQFSGSMS